MEIKKSFLVLLFSLAFINASYAIADEFDVRFMSEPCLIPMKDNRFKTCDNLIAKVNNEFHIVPRGFKTDLASIPRILWSVFSPGDYDVIAPAVLHDWHYCCSKDVDRLKADTIFYYSLKWHGMGWPKALVYYFAVRVAGGSSYKHGEGMSEHTGQFDVAELQGVYQDVNRLV
jgi:hypothetical protein